MYDGSMSTGFQYDPSIKFDAETPGSFVVFIPAGADSEALGMAGEKDVRLSLVHPLFHTK